MARGPWKAVPHPRSPSFPRTAWGWSQRARLLAVWTTGEADVRVGRDPSAEGTLSISQAEFYPPGLCFQITAPAPESEYSFLGLDPALWDQGLWRRQGRGAPLQRKLQTFGHSSQHPSPAPSRASPLGAGSGLSSRADPEGPMASEVLRWETVLIAREPPETLTAAHPRKRDSRCSVCDM